MDLKTNEDTKLGDYEREVNLRGDGGGRWIWTKYNVWDSQRINTEVYIYSPYTYIYGERERWIEWEDWLVDRQKDWLFFNHLSVDLGFWFSSLALDISYLNQGLNFQHLNLWCILNALSSLWPKASWWKTYGGQCSLISLDGPGNKEKGNGITQLSFSFLCLVS